MSQPTVGMPLRCLMRLTGLRWRYSNPPPTWRRRSPYILYPSGTWWSSPESKSCYDRRSVTQYVLVPRPRGFRWAPSEEFQSDIRRGTLRRNFLLALGGLHVKHAVQRGIWVPTQHLFWDLGKPRKNLIELAGHRAFRFQTGIEYASPNVSP
jgi:hypothetical protein